MIVIETLLREIFEQIPPMVYVDINKGESSIPVKFHWGNQDDLTLYMKKENGNTTPLIWLVQGDKDEIQAGEVNRKIRLILAKSSEHKTSMNPKVWDTEFVEFLNPLLDLVLKCLNESGVTQIMDRKYSVYREANYSEFERDSQGKKTSTTTIDHWNVITLECELLLQEANQCVRTINFNF